MSRPYAFINDEMNNYTWLRDQILSSADTHAKFDQLNQHVHNEVILPGQLIVVPHDTGSMCTPEETELMYLAQGIHYSMIGHDYTRNKIMLQNYDLLQSIMAYGSIGIGSSTAAWSKHLNGVEDTLKRIETLHKSWKAGGLVNDQFFAQRRTLFSKLETQMKGIGQFGTGLKRNGKIKNMLGISSKSYLHTGEIAGYAKTVKSISKTAKALSGGAYVGIALDLGVGVLEVQEACTVGREDQCRKAKYVEGGKAVLGIPASMVGGWAGGASMSFLCLAIGVPTAGAGTLACAIIGGAAGAWVGGTLGSSRGEEVGTVIYETFQ